MRIFAKSLRSHRALKSMPAMFVITPKEMTTRHADRVNKGRSRGDPVRAHFREGHESHKAGKREQTEADADEHRHEVIDRSIPGERSAGC